MGQGKTTNLIYSFTFWKTKEKFPVVSPVSCKNQVKHIILIIMPQDGARSVEQVYPYKAGEITRYKVNQQKKSAIRK